MTMDPEKAVCAKCKFYQITDLSNISVGECHRMPPQLVLVPMPQGLAMQGGFPPTKNTNWCGEYAIKLTMCN